MACTDISEMTEQEEKPAVGYPDSDVALKKCVSILNAAKTDNERFAALLLVTQLVQSNKIGSTGRRTLFDAVGFTFINRLLSTKAVPDECPSTMFKSLAVTILACFSTDEELLFHPQMTAKISFFLEVVSSPNDDGLIIEEACQILSAFASSELGCDHLLRRRSVEIFCEILKNYQGSNNRSNLVCRTLKKILHFCPEEAWKQHGESLIELLVILSENFKIKQDLSKFSLCEDLKTLLSTADISLFTKSLEKSKVGNMWQSNIKIGLGEILQSKVKPEQRNMALALSSVLSELVGVQWMLGDSTLTSQVPNSFFMLVLSSASIEVRMIIDHTQQETLADKLPLVSVCYSILEKAVSLMSVCVGAEDNTDSLEDTLTKGYTVVTEALACVTRYLIKVSLNQQLSGIEGDEKDFLYASVRLLCAWMAEETMALRQEIMELLPFLLELAEESFKSKTPPENKTGREEKKVHFHLVSDDITQEMASMSMADESASPGEDQPRVITFLLPALCHLSADDRPRKVLIDRRADVLLNEYFVFVYEKWIERKMEDNLSESTLTMLIGIFLNFAVTEPALVGSSASFIALCHYIVHSLPALSDKHEHIVLLANEVVLGLMLLRQQHDREFKDPAEQKSLEDFFQVVLGFLRAAVRCTDKPELTELQRGCTDKWSEIAELWFLGVDVVVACLKVIQSLKEIVRCSGWLEDIKSCLSDQNGRGKNLSPEMVEALTKLVTETGEGKD